MSTSIVKKSTDIVSTLTGLAILIVLIMVLVDKFIIPLGGKKLSPPFEISCGQTVPTIWEDGVVFHVMENGQTLYTSPQLRQSGISIMSGQWISKDSGYIVNWVGGARVNGGLFRNPSTWNIEKITRTGKNDSGDVTVDMVMEQGAFKCIQGT